MCERDRTRRDRSETFLLEFFGFLTHDHLSCPSNDESMSTITYRQYMGESDLPYIMALVQHELSEPYVIYTYRYFLHQWYAPFSYLLDWIVH